MLIFSFDLFISLIMFVLFFRFVTKRTDQEIPNFLRCKKLLTSNPKGRFSFLLFVFEYFTVFISFICLLNLSQGKNSRRKTVRLFLHTSSTPAALLLGSAARRLSNVQDAYYFKIISAQRLYNCM